MDGHCRVGECAVNGWVNGYRIKMVKGTAWWKGQDCERDRMVKG